MVSHFALFLNSRKKRKKRENVADEQMNKKWM